MTTYDPTNTKDWQTDGNTVFLLEEVQRRFCHTTIQNKFYAQVSSAGRRDRAGEEAIAAQICAALNSKQPSTLEALSQLVDASYTEATRAWQEAGETGAMGYYRGRRAAFGEIKAELDRLIAAGSKADGT